MKIYSTLKPKNSDKILKQLDLSLHFSFTKQNVFLQTSVIFNREYSPQFELLELISSFSISDNEATFVYEDTSLECIIEIEA